MIFPAIFSILKVFLAIFLNFTFFSPFSVLIGFSVHFRISGGSSPHFLYSVDFSSIFLDWTTFLKNLCKLNVSHSIFSILTVVPPFPKFRRFFPAFVNSKDFFRHFLKFNHFAHHLFIITFCPSNFLNSTNYYFPFSIPMFSPILFKLNLLII